MRAVSDKSHALGGVNLAYPRDTFVCFRMALRFKWGFTNKEFITEHTQTPQVNLSYDKQIRIMINKHKIGEQRENKADGNAKKSTKPFHRAHALQSFLGEDSPVFHKELSVCKEDSNHNCICINCWEIYSLTLDYVGTFMHEVYWESSIIV